MARRRGGQSNASGDRMTESIENVKSASRPSARTGQGQADGGRGAGTILARSKFPVRAVHSMKTPCSDKKNSLFRKRQGIRLRAIEIARRIYVGNRRKARKFCKIPVIFPVARELEGRV
jgi:hypothetical protein